MSWSSEFPWENRSAPAAMLVPPRSPPTKIRGTALGSARLSRMRWYPRSSSFELFPPSALVHFALAVLVCVRGGDRRGRRLAMRHVDRPEKMQAIADERPAERAAVLRLREVRSLLVCRVLADQALVLQEGER